MSFDLSKCPRNEAGHYLCRTKEGQKVRLVATDVNKVISGVRYPLGGLLELGDKSEVFHSWQADGRFYPYADSHTTDLENLPTKVKRFINVYRSVGRAEWVTIYSSEDEAKRNEDYGTYRIAIAIPVEFEVKP